MRHKKVLIIAYYFPPRHTIGSVRPMGLAKYLPEYGWEPLIMTANLPGPAPGGLRVIQTEYIDIISKLKGLIGYRPDVGLHEQLGLSVSKNGINRSLLSSMISKAEATIAFPDEHIGWYKFAVREGERLLERQDIDAIMSTSSPVTSHLIARTLKVKSGKPWIADFRDLWTQHHYYRHGVLRNFVDRKLEIRTLNQADALVTANPLVSKFKDLHNNKLMYCIPNGFDPDDFPEPSLPRTNHNKFTITYTGQLYNGKRDPEPLFRALAELIGSGEIKRAKLEVCIFGPFENWLLKDVRKYNLHDVVKIKGLVSREESLRMQMESSLLLILTNPREAGIYPAKVFEYLGAHRPILAIGGPGGALKELLNKTQAGIHVLSLAQLKKVLIEYYRAHQNKAHQTGSTILYHAVKEQVQNYTHPVMAQKFAQVLDEISVSRHG
jgi:glycosyltransferase involved in cell wall biosynthesis